MLFEKRRHQFQDIVSVRKLAELLTEMTWTLCTGWRLHAENQVLYVLNDSTSEDGAQEYAILASDGRQLETITFGWCNADEAETHIWEILNGSDMSDWLGRWPLLVEPSEEHTRCYHCA